MEKKKTTMIKIVRGAVLTLAALLVLNRLFMPKYMSKPYEGALTGEYYGSEKNHDLLIIGDCEAYENISPVTLWEQYGITSYIRGSAQQLVWQSYYLLADALRYEKPKVVVFSVLALKYNEPQNEAYNRLTIDGMRLSPEKLAAVNASRMDDESGLSYLFPLLRYHDRWRELTAEDFRYYFNTQRVSHNGFMMRCDVKPMTVLPKAPRLADYNFGETSYLYLDKITKLCKDNGIALVLLKAPALYPHWYDEWDAQMALYAAENELLYVNALNALDEIGIDFETDTYDAGLHLNLSGAEKTAVYLGEILKENYDLVDNREDPDISAAWAVKVREYNDMRRAQEDDLARYGEIRTFLIP